MAFICYGGNRQFGGGGYGCYGVPNRGNWQRVMQRKYEILAQPLLKLTNLERLGIPGKHGRKKIQKQLEKKIQKQPGRFFPLDIDYGVDKKAPKKNQQKEDSKLAPPLAELMKMLFNVETYRAAMMEFEINMSEMPLGKLSKYNIQKGFEALTEIQNLLKNSGHNPSMLESLIVDASNRFFTMISSIHPHVIRDEYDFKSKLKLLEALQDIEIASKLVGFNVANDESLDDKYKKLRCDIDPIPRDSEDYSFIEAATGFGIVLNSRQTFSIQLSYMECQVLSRLAPFERGLYEDYVANFWCNSCFLR